MGQSLAGAAVRGMSTATTSTEATELLAEGDIEGLLSLHRRRFGGMFMMAEKDDDADEDDDAEDGDDDEDGDEDDDDDDEDSDDSEDEKDRRIQELSAEGKKRRLKNRELRSRVSELEAEIARLKGKQKSSKDDADKDDDAEDDASAKLETENKELARTNEDLLIRLEFMGNTQYNWKNPKAALRLLDLSDVEITEDGEVEGLEDAIKELAKNEPYLLKGKDDEDEDSSKKRKTGQPPSKRKKGNPNRDKLRSKYPALRR